MKRLNPVVPVVLSFVILCGALVLCESVSDKSEEMTNLFYHYYSFEPTSLLEEIEAGNINVFSPIAEEPPLVPSDQQISVPWTQGDYFRIANALFEFARGDTLDGWQLNSMYFILGCPEFGTGLQDGNLEFFKIVKTNERVSRIVRIVNIYPRNKYVFITENEYYPKLVDWSSINFGENMFSADAVLQIADKAGGQVKRLSVENACNISLLLSPDSASYEGWWAHYYRRDDDTTLFRVKIDPITGEVR